VVHIFYGAEEALDFGGSFLLSKPESTKRTTAPEVFGWSHITGQRVTVEGHRSRESVLLRGKRMVKEVHVFAEKRSLPDSR